MSPSRKPNRLIPRKDAVILGRRLRRSRKRIAFTNGVFDILHRGHVEYLQAARDAGDVLIVGLNTDASVRRLKGPSRPIQPQRDRAAILLALRAVDFVVMFGEDTPAKLIREIRPHVLVKGADYRLDQIVGADFVLAQGGEVKRIPLRQGRSSSSIIKRLS